MLAGLRFCAIGTAAEPGSVVSPINACEALSGSWGHTVDVMGLLVRFTGAALSVAAAAGRRHGPVPALPDRGEHTPLRDI
jgi:hypothetical protein